MQFAEINSAWSSFGSCIEFFYCKVLKLKCKYFILKSIEKCQLIDLFCLWKCTKCIQMRTALHLKAVLFIENYICKGSDY